MNCYNVRSVTIRLLIIKLVLFILCFCYSINLSAKICSLEKDPTNESTPKDSVKQKDVVDLIHATFKIKLRNKPDSIKAKGLGPFFSIMPAVGYALVSGVTGALTTNTSFYTDSTKNKFSSLLVNAFYSQYNQYWFTLNGNIFFEKAKIHIVSDWRYYKFPTLTYGEGSKSLFKNAVAIDYSYLRIYQYVYREVFQNFFLGLGYHMDYHWNITENVDTGAVYKEIIKNTKGNHSTSTGISFDVTYDSRKNSTNAQGGSYLSIQLRPNFTIMGSDNNWTSLKIDLRHYLHFPASSENILAFWSYNNFTLGRGNPPYLDMPSIGWDDYSNTGRGYAQGRYVARNLTYFETEYRFKLTYNGLLGGVVFANAQYLFKYDPESINNMIPACGLGLRIKINKHSNTNLGIDYGFGVGGSQGFFFNLGEVF